jgi:drug/metabolite transporter (DMT)-like permease
MIQFLKRRLHLAHRRTHRAAGKLPVALQGMLWMVLGGMMFSMLNVISRKMTLELDAFETQFLRYLCGLFVLLPVVLRAGAATFWPRDIKGQFWRGGVHTAGLMLWFIALPHIPMADMTAISFTGPIFIMIGAAWFLGERMRRDRWLAALFGFVGVVVVLLPHLSSDGGVYHLIMLSSAPVFAASFLITKALTRYESPGVIVLWQAITVAIFSLPMAVLHWQNPSAWQWANFLAAGVLGTVAHYCMTRALHVADISATQSMRFLDLLWSSLMGWWVFTEVPSETTWIGASVIVLSTVWIARREGQRKAVAAPEP